MANVLNTPLKGNKACAVALNDIYGLGRVVGNQICDQLGFSPEIKCKQLNANQLDRLTRSISLDYSCNGHLREIVKGNKERYISISSYRGFRYSAGLPCRGQRTHGNAQTVRRGGAKGPAATGGKRKNR